MVNFRECYRVSIGGNAGELQNAYPKPTMGQLVTLVSNF